MATQQGNVAAAIFLMKARALWRDRPETQAEQITAPTPRAVIVAPPKPASVEEWLAQHAPEHARGTIVVRTGVPRNAPGSPCGA
ncbi:MAG TPA: hypothetical protein VEA40_12725 [Ramlibacter sp.]|nr:hypothetical protein [Ramlibacter sp.]